MFMEMTQAGEMPTNLMTDSPGRIVRQEQIWFDKPQEEGGADPSKVSAFRWAGYADKAREEVSTIAADGPVLGIALRPMDLTVFAADKLVHDGRMQQGTIRVNQPGQRMRGIYRGAYDALHLHIPNTVIAECIAKGCGQSVTDPMSLAPSQPAFDPVIERLAHALVHADDFGSSFGQCYADSIGLAIVARLLGRSAGTEASATGSRVSALAKWRLKRAVDYIDANLSESIGLTEIAAATGLTRMHFAAQFRAATGVRPHEYLVRRRIERAQQLLTTTRLPLVEIALDVGFKTQAHFTTVFSRIVGETPNAWRQENHTGRVAASASRRIDLHETATCAA